MIEGAEGNGVFGGSVEPDLVATGVGGEISDFADAFEADSAICCGPYAAYGWVQTIGQHASVYQMLAPNSTWIPSAFWESHIRNVIVPSEWAKKVVMHSAPYELNVHVVPHGILSGHGRPPELGPKPSSRLLMLHFAGSSLERKGTYALLEAYKHWEGRRHSLLSVIVNPIEWKTVNDLVQSMGLRSCVLVSTRLNVSPSVMAYLYATSSAIIQPSRAEAFGLIPLEALAAGVPVVMTLCTGHRQYAVKDDATIDGVVEIETGPNKAVYYDPGGTAPSVEPEAITKALDCLLLGFDNYKSAAMNSHKRLMKDYAWPAVTKEFFEKLREDNA
jgi:glycosyltransferase involved in cell wall biosynthesis